jgi:MoxR-like ATPase
MISTIPSTLPNNALIDDDVAAIDRLGHAYSSLTSELAKVIIGQEAVIEQLAICLFARSHALLVGVPGLAKTLLVSRLAETLELEFSRIQFTPDLMPMDITGTDILQQSELGRREFEFAKGPLFSNVVLADEINRAPAKTQAAMLEAMQEHRVTVVGRTYQLDDPFFVLATQNPIEQEGTYPLPEAQLDRFMFLIHVDYPTRQQELSIAKSTTGAMVQKLDRILTKRDVLSIQSLVRRIPVPEHVYEFAVDLTRMTRPEDSSAPSWMIPLVSWGAGPRAVQYLILGTKARAALHGNYIGSMDDLEAVAESVLGHRILTTFEAESDGITSQSIVRRLIAELNKKR